MSPIEVCRVTSELSLALPAPDYIIHAMTYDHDAAKLTYTDLCSSHLFFFGRFLIEYVSLAISPVWVHSAKASTQQCQHSLLAILRLSSGEDIEPVLAVGCTEEGWV